jgi:hypothetical protein
MEGWAKFKVDSLNIQKIDEEDIVTSDSDTMSIGSFKSQLPFYFRLGGSYKFSEDLVVGKVLALKSSTGESRQKWISI